jgi:hypothetical protein
MLPSPCRRRARARPVAHPTWLEDILLSRFAGPTHALLTMVSGLLFVCPGGMKLLGWFGGMPGGMKLTPLLVVAGVIELVGGACTAYQAHPAKGEV